MTLDVIGEVGFGFDFQCGESPEALALRQAWNQANIAGLTFSGFLGPVILRAFPWIAHLPLRALKTQARLKDILQGIAAKLMASKEKNLEAGEDLGNDLLGKLMKMRGTDGLDNQNILDQVCPSGGLPTG